MTRDVIFRRQYFAAVSESQAARYRAAPADLARLSKRTAGHSLGEYWQAVPYLITGRTTNLKEPLRWFTDGAARRASPPLRVTRWWSRPTRSSGRSRR